MGGLNMANEKKNNPNSTLTILAIYFVINSILIFNVHSSIAKIIIIGIDILLAVVIAMLYFKFAKGSKGNK
jgi:hypothetical protein